VTKERETCRKFRVRGVYVSPCVAILLSGIINGA